MLKIDYKPTDNLKETLNNARVHSEKQIGEIARSIEVFGFNNPILIDDDQRVIAGNGRLLAAKKLSIATVPTVLLSHMSKHQIRAYILADNKLAEKAKWDSEILKIEFQNLIEIDFDLSLTGFETPEVDFHLNVHSTLLQEDLFNGANENIHQRVKSGDVWELGNHRLLGGDSLNPVSFSRLMHEELADLIFTDPPYNVPIKNNVCGKGKVQHEDFAFASGEMSKEEFISFLQKSFSSLKQYSKCGSIHFICMDWRHVAEVCAASEGIYSDFKNICVWNKLLPGMGSLYRSQHEFVFVFKNGKSPHLNNIELGKHGRNRTNIWDYEGVHISSHHKYDLKLHPTTKPVQLIADAIMDCSKPGQIILDCFGGSGSTLLAAELTNRKCRIIEYEPKYCDVILHRFEKMTNLKARYVGELINVR